MSERFFLDQDNDCHWCVVPVARKAEWEAFLAIPEGDERGWELPEGVQQVGGSQTLVTFTDPVVEE